MDQKDFYSIAVQSTLTDSLWPHELQHARLLKILQYLPEFV